MTERCPLSVRARRSHRRPDLRQSAFRTLRRWCLPAANRPRQLWWE